LKFYSVAITVWTGDFAFFVIFMGKSFEKALVTIMADELVMRHGETSACNKSENYLSLSRYSRQPVNPTDLALPFLSFWGIIKLRSHNCRRDYFLPDSTRAAASILARAGSYL
jgi:hypothetical protein